MSHERIHAAIEPLRQALLEHPVYRAMREPAALRIFLQHHAFAVWDFMSLLKALQQHLCCTAVPWLPPADGAAARLINEIVLGEESDEDGRGGYASHFDLYHRAMTRFGADTTAIDGFLAALRSGVTIRAALKLAGVSTPIRRFVEHTFAVIESGDLCRIAAAFTFGREDLLPGVFQRIVDEIDAQVGGLNEFRFYLVRHIELDGGQHGPMSERLITSLCGNDPSAWERAEAAAVESLQARLDLWDGIHTAIKVGVPASAGPSSVSTA